jgi:hypothetical protein
MAHEYKLPKITLDEARAMDARQRFKTLRFEEELRKTQEAKGFSWNKKGWPADVLQHGDPTEWERWVSLGSPTGDQSVEDIMGLNPRVREYLKRYSKAAGTGVNAVRTLRGRKTYSLPPTGGRRRRKTRKTRRSRK